MKQHIQALFDQEMDRKQFLKMSGTLVLGVIGLTTIARLFSEGIVPSAASHTPQPTINSGYGR